MKIKQLLYGLAGVAIMAAATSCEDQKDLIIIEGNLPIKTSTLYMVGDATPTGWSIDSPTPLEATEEDPLVFTWEGSLNPGELKLCLTTGSWSAGFIRPMTSGSEIGTEPITDEEFQMHAGDPDEKWRVVAAGTYNLRFDLRNWTMSSAYLGAGPEPTKDPIATDVLYIVGDATPAGWSIESPTALEKTGEYIFEYEGALIPGEMKACVASGSWDVDFIRPQSNGCEINKDGVATDEFVFTANPDNKWKVTEAGIYHLVFDLENYTLTAEYTGELVIEQKPIETATLFMIGDATPGGWSMDDATALTVSPDNKYIFSWEGDLVEGSMKACTVQDGTFSCPFIRPSTAGCEIGVNGVAATDFVYTTNPDDQWHISAAGRYNITFDLEHYTIAVRYVSGGNEGGDTRKPIETKTLYMIGEATAGGWSMDDATALTVSPDNKYVFSWEGELKTGLMKACTVQDGTFSCPFLRPSTARCEIGVNGVAAPDFVYTTEPDDQWNVTAAGRYNITFDLEHYTIAVRYVSGGNEGGDTRKPIETTTLYMVGDATPGGWSMDNATALTVSPDNKYVFSWEGKLTRGEMKACLEPDGTFSCPFVRPTQDGCRIDASGVESAEIEYSTEPDKKWRIEKEGRYKVTFNLQNWSIEAKYLD